MLILCCLRYDTNSTSQRTMKVTQSPDEDNNEITD